MPHRFLSTVTIGLLASVSIAAAPASQARSFENALRRTVPIAGAENQRFKLADRMAHYRVPGVSVAVIENCRIVEARGFGLTAWKGGRVTPGTLFQAGSISKSVTALGALRLAERGVLQLDSDVRPLTKSWAYDGAKGTVTLRRLLGHTAGTNVPGMKGYAPGAPLPGIGQILAGEAPANTAAVTVEEEPGRRWIYSGGGYAVVQALMSETTGRDFAPLMQELVLAPLAMADSSFTQPLPPARNASAARGTASDGSILPGEWRVYPELAAAGLWTTPSDLARFAIGLARSVRGEGGAIIGDKMASELMTRGPGNWGLGVDLGPPDGPRQISHTGKTVGYTSMFVIYPDRCQGAVVMTNGYDGGWLINEIMRAIGDTYRWPAGKQLSPQTTVALSDAIARRFVGRYRLSDFPAERFSITRDPQGHLYWAREGHVGRTLLPQSEDRLFSPDSVMTIEALDKEGAQAAKVALGFGGGTNMAERVE